MKILNKQLRKPQITPGLYEFSIVHTNVLWLENKLQVAYRLGREDDDSYRVYHLETYPIDLAETSDFSRIMKKAFTSIYPDFIVEVDTDEISMTTYGYCNIDFDDSGEAKIDIESMEFFATMCGEIDLDDEDRDIFCN